MKKFYLTASPSIGICTFLLLLLSFSVAHAQVPQDLPRPQDNEPINFNSLAELIVFIAIPVVALLLYFFLKRRKKNRNK